MDLYEDAKRSTAFDLSSSFCLSRADKSKAFYSPRVNENKFVKVTVKMETRNSPQRATMTPMNLPTPLFGNMSPYPTVVMVMMTPQMEFSI
jgi:hypothetical protein